MYKTIEQTTSETILGEPMIIKVGKRKYKVAPPCLATMIRVSGLISYMPNINDAGSPLYESLAVAKHSYVINEILATMILGAKKIERSFLGKYRLKLLAKKISYSCTVEEVLNNITEIIKTMQVSDFFGLSVFLHEISVIQKEKETEI